MSQGSVGADGEQKIFLTGFMGSGKTTVGRRLARDLGWGFVDLDDIVEREAGKTISRIFAEQGEGSFRALERLCLCREAKRPTCLVIATGGGIVLDAHNRELMDSKGITFWLHPKFEVIAGRLGKSSRARRPLFVDREKARELHRERLDLYRTATHEISVEVDETASDVAARISFLVRGKSCDTW